MLNLLLGVIKNIEEMLDNLMMVLNDDIFNR